MSEFVPTDPAGFGLKASGEDIELHCLRCGPDGVMIDWWVPIVPLSTILDTVRSHNAVMHP